MKKKGTIFKAVVASAKPHSFSEGELKDKATVIDYPMSVLKEAFSGLDNVEVTLNHPTNKDDRHIIGTATNFTFEDNKVYADIKISNKTLRSDIAYRDKTELSWGGVSHIEWDKEDEYNGKLTKIEIDHIAVVDFGRCGAECAIHNQKSKKNDNIINPNNGKEKEMVKVLLNGKEYEVAQNVADEIKQTMAKKEGEIEALKLENTALKSKAEAYDKEKELAQRVEVMNKIETLMPNFVNGIQDIDEKSTLELINSAFGKQFDSLEIGMAVLNSHIEFGSQKEVKNGVAEPQKGETTADIYSNFIGGN